MGISKEVIDKYFTGTVSRVGGISMADIQADVEALHNAAFDPLGLDINMELADSGAHKFRSGKEEHLFNPQTIHLFQKACRTGDYDTFKQFTQTVDNMGAEGVHLRSLLDFNYAADVGIPLEEVEPVSSIVKRFKGAAMSYGALSSEAHETIAIALNRLGCRSNTGEGGEPEERYHSESNSKIKQVASARFGVTSKYLVSAEEIQIKLAQGAKPGEGGNLPGAKVYPWIAIVAKAQEAVKKVAQKGAYVAVFNTTIPSMVYYDEAAMTDLRRELLGCLAFGEVSCTLWQQDLHIYPHSTG